MQSAVNGRFDPVNLFFHGRADNGFVSDQRTNQFNIRSVARHCFCLSQYFLGPLGQMFAAAEADSHDIKGILAMAAVTFAANTAGS